MRSGWRILDPTTNIHPDTFLKINFIHKIPSFTIQVLQYSENVLIQYPLSNFVRADTQYHDTHLHVLHLNLH